MLIVGKLFEKWFVGNLLFYYQLRLGHPCTFPLGSPGRGIWLLSCHVVLALFEYRRCRCRLCRSPTGYLVWSVIFVLVSCFIFFEAAEWPIVESIGIWCDHLIGCFYCWILYHLRSLWLTYAEIYVECRTFSKAYQYFATIVEVVFLLSCLQSSWRLAVMRPQMCQ